jgi:hypothetical protein
MCFDCDLGQAPFFVSFKKKDSFFPFCSFWRGVFSFFFEDSPFSKTKGREGKKKKGGKGGATLELCSGCLVVLDKMDFVNDRLEGLSPVQCAAVGAGAATTAFALYGVTQRADDIKRAFFAGLRAAPGTAALYAKEQAKAAKQIREDVHGMQLHAEGVPEPVEIPDVAMSHEDILRAARLLSEHEIPLRKAGKVRSVSASRGDPCSPLSIAYPNPCAIFFQHPSRCLVSCTVARRHTRTSRTKFTRCIP